MKQSIEQVRRSRNETEHKIAGSSVGGPVSVPSEWLSGY